MGIIAGTGVRAGVAAAAIMVSVASAGLCGAQNSVPARRNVISINPLGVPFEYFSVEGERAITGLTSVGLTGSYLGRGDGSYTTIDGKLRFYPNEEGPKGFSVGLAAGVTRVAETVFSQSGVSGDRSESRPTLGVIIDYNWILGKAKRFVVGTGVGAKRVLGANGDDFNDILVAYPTARFQIGIRY